MNLENVRYMFSIDGKTRRFRVCLILGEDEDNYIGHWISGFGDMKQRFPKEKTRPFTEEEIKNYQSQSYCKSKKIPFPLPITNGGKIKLKK